MIFISSPKIECNTLNGTKNLFENTKDIISAIKFGEKAFQKSLQNLNAETRDLYNIMLVISKSLSINILDLESFNKSFNEGFVVILEILSFLNMEEESLDKIKSIIKKAQKVFKEASGCNGGCH